MSALNLLYRGPRAWLVWLNLLVACVALVPSLVECLMWLLHEAGGFPLGQLAAFPAVAGALLLAAIAENWYVAGVPVLLACVLLPILLRASEIPPRVRTVTALVVTAALVIMMAHVGVLYLQNRHGRFKGLFI